jgi:hypothetical protein
MGLITGYPSVAFGFLHQVDSSRSSKPGKVTGGEERTTPYEPGTGWLKNSHFATLSTGVKFSRILAAAFTVLSSCNKRSSAKLILLAASLLLIMCGSWRHSGNTSSKTPGKAALLQAGSNFTLAYSLNKHQQPDFSHKS